MSDMVQGAQEKCQLEQITVSVELGLHQGLKLEVIWPLTMHLAVNQLPKAAKTKLKFPFIQNIKHIN